MHIFNLFISSIFIFALAIPSGAQIIVQGTVTDSLDTPIPNVNIYATGPDSTTIQAYDYSNNRGAFSLALKLCKPYLLHVSSLGYEKRIIKIPAQTIPDTLVKNFTLRKEVQQLKELVVEAEQRRAIITKKDTTIFIAESFLQGDEVNVEDILKMLPGITVDSQGRIKANGKTVTKVLIGGDDLFGYNYSLLTKNFTADAIETVSIYDHYQENEALKGISNSEETVLNLGLKEEFKIDFFGTASGYYDLDKNYQVDGNIVSITKKFKGYLFESANNIGDNPVGNIYNLLQSGSSLPFQSSTALGSNIDSSPFIGTSTYRVSRLDQEQYLNNQTSFHALSGIYNPTEKLEIKGVGYFLPANRRINQEFITTYDPSVNLPDLTEQENTQKHIDAWLGKLTGKYTFSQNSNLKYEGDFNSLPETQQTNQFFRNTPLQTRLQTNKKVWNQYLGYTRKLANGKAYRIRSRYKNSSTDQNFRVNQTLADGPFDSDTAAAPLIQQTESDGSYIGTDFKYWSRKPNSLFSIRVGGEWQGFKLKNFVANQPGFTDARFWNRYRSFSTLSYRQTLFQHLEIYGNLTGNYVWNNTNLQADIDDQLFYVSPKIGLKYQLGKRQEIQLQYAYNQDIPNIKTLFKGKRLTSYRSINIGTNHFSLTPSNNLSVSYRYGNWQDDFVANAFFNYSSSDKNYTTATTITPTYNFGTFRIVQDQDILTSRLGIDQFLNFMQSNLAVEYNFSKIDYTSFFNNTANDIHSNSHTLSTFIRTAFIGALNAAAGVDYSLSNTQNKTSNENNNYQYFGGFLSSNLDIGEKFSAKAEYQYYQIESAGSYSFVNATLKYKLIKDKLTLYLDARNILDETLFQTISLGSYSDFKRQNKLNPRYILVGLKVNIR